ncbi:N-glycosylase/DNA lyase [Acidianus brierleyi]|uniref:8-oxoguanine DNA glycosylase/AP lyase n=1 Tax=Acidianus brierleyi TaxID=41673 RepID=A0A2U9IFZ7_9CREN|nr:N-glycosylase/DNA lyase [Acidianus brierleyi]AWR94961.1 N-glycosylase/DNA lyase [Acidianus brierleyi]
MLRNLLKDVKLRARVLERAEEFKLNNLSNENVWFRELVLCILTANSSFISAYNALQNLGDKIFYENKENISLSLKKSGYRFYNIKSYYIVKDRELIYGKLKNTIKNIAETDQLKAREYLLKLYGIGMKEASHFLRNVGYFNLAIIDRHILNFLSDYVEIRNKQLSRSEYIYLESILRSISTYFNLYPGLLDLFIWFKETKMIVK